MPFSKFDPHRPDEAPRLDAAQRRALLLKYGWWISVAYTAIGFGFIAYWLAT